MNWIVHTDGNLLYYDNRTLAERFPEIQMNLRGARVKKSILRGNIDTKVTDNHYINSDFLGCNGFGKIQKLDGIRSFETDHYYYYIDHYWSKSTEEFVNKLLRGDAILGLKNKDNNLRRISMYFSINNITTEQINYIENRTKYN